MTPKISELSTLKMEKERAYEDQLKSQIKWLSQLKWNWANNRDKNNEKFFYYFFDFCFQNFEIERSTSKLEDRSYEEQLKNQIKWLSQLMELD
ncbi:hypothetical protein U3516DRAFT_766778 [Neocallimastix sp. 'constans']